MQNIPHHRQYRGNIFHSHSADSCIEEIFFIVIRQIPGALDTERNHLMTMLFKYLLDVEIIPFRTAADEIAVID